MMLRGLTKRVVPSAARRVDRRQQPTVQGMLLRLPGRSFRRASGRLIVNDRQATFRPFLQRRPEISPAMSVQVRPLRSESISSPANSS
jgi:hypothetical protein